ISGRAGAPGFEPGIEDPKSSALPLGHAPSSGARCGTWRKSRWGLSRGLPVRAGGPFAPFDELRDAPAALAAELRVAFAAELALAGLATAAAELRVAFAAELPFPSLPALSAEVGVATGAELLLAGLTATAADLAVELGSVLGGRVLSALAPSLPDAHVIRLVHL